MRQKVLGVVWTFFTTIPWLFPAWHGWCQSRPVLTVQSESAVLMDGTTGQILFKKNPEKLFHPASLAKVMTLYLALDAIRSGDAKFDDEVLVSKKAWKMGGSQMFLEIGDKVKFIELIKGVAAISANDGALSIAEFLTGSEEVFVYQMNEKARALGMKDTHFANPHGLPREGRHTTAFDMATLGFHYINEHPDALKFHTLPEYMYRGIKQKNWNPLLDLDQGVDGLKTGYLKTAGYHILFSAKKDGRRLIGVVMGAETAEARNGDALKLLGYGLKNFSTLTLVKEGDVVGKVKVQNGDPPEVDLSATETLIVTIRKGMEETIPFRKEIPSSVNPPIRRGTVLGKLILEGEGFSKREIDLVSNQDAQVRTYAAYFLIGLAVVVAGFAGFVFWKRQGLRKKR